jgi:hypothetical protein
MQVPDNAGHNAGPLRSFVIIYIMRSNDGPVRLGTVTSGYIEVSGRGRSSRPSVKSEPTHELGHASSSDGEDGRFAILIGSKPSRRWSIASVSLGKT